MSPRAARGAFKRSLALDSAAIALAMGPTAEARREATTLTAAVSAPATFIVVVAHRLSASLHQRSQLCFILRGLMHVIIIVRCTIFVLDLHACCCFLQFLKIIFLGLQSCPSLIYNELEFSRFSKRRLSCNQADMSRGNNFICCTS